MSGTETENKPKKRTRVKVDPMDLYALTLPPYHMSVKDIAAKYGMHEVTCSNKITEAKKKLEPMFAAQREEIEKMKEAQSQQVAIRTAQSGGGLTIPPGSVPQMPANNPFHSLTSFAEVASPSIQAGLVLGSGVSLLLEGSNMNLPPEQRQEMWGKAGIVLLTFGRSLLDTLAEVDRRNKLNPPKEGEQ
jgi:predicted DNA-binding protein (UPF0251 family)